MRRLHQAFLEQQDRTTVGPPRGLICKNWTAVKCIMVRERGGQRAFPPL